MSKEKNRCGERGGAGVKFLFVLTMLILVGHALINYVPVAYSAESMKSDMQTAVVQGMGMPARAGTPNEFITLKLKRAVEANDLPKDTFIEVKMNGKVTQARVYYVQTINLLPFGIYKYNYLFDHTATPTGFLLKEGD